MRIVCWNVRAGGGRRIEEIAGQLRRWRPEVVALSEFRATPPSQQLASRLHTFGLVHQLTTADPARAAVNCLLLASRWPLRRVRVRGREPEAGRWLGARVDAPQRFTLGTLHVPLVSGRKYPFLAAVLRLAKRSSLATRTAGEWASMRSRPRSPGAKRAGSLRWRRPAGPMPTGCSTPEREPTRGTRRTRVMVSVWTKPSSTKSYCRA